MYDVNNSQNYGTPTPPSPQYGVGHIVGVASFCAWVGVMLGLIFSIVFGSVDVLAIFGEKDAYIGDTTTAPEYGGKWAGVSFEDETLRIEYNSYVQSMLTATGSPHYYNKFIEGPDWATTDPVDNAVYERNTEVAERLGMTIEWSEDTTSAVTELFTHFESIIGAGNAPHIVINMNYGLVRAEVNGLLYNLKTNYGDYSKNLFSFEGEACKRFR